MKKFKIIDFWISITLIAIFFLESIVMQDSLFMIGYCVVGGWQVLSMLVHTFKKWFTGKGSFRNYYHWIVLIALGTMPVGSFYILLFTAPFMAVYYTGLCYSEVKKMNQRPLALLK